MFWSEDEQDREGLLERFERESETGEPGFYSWQALEVLFEHYLELGDRRMAERVLGHARYLYEGEPRLHLWYSYLAAFRNKLVEAHAHIERAFQLLPLNRAVYEHYVDILIQLGRYQEACWVLESYEEAFPELAWQVWRYGAELFRLRKRWNEVRWCAWHGLGAARPEGTYFWWQLMQAYRHSGEVGQGIQDFWQALWEAPLDYRLWIGLACLYEQKLAYTQAQAALEEAEKLLLLQEEEPEKWWALYHYVQGRLYEAMGRWEEAFRAYLWVQRYRPQAVAGLLGIIRYYHRQERWSEAEPHLRQAVRRGRGHPAVQALVAEHLWAQGDWSLAAQFYEELLRYPLYAERAMERLLLHYAEQSDRKSFWRILHKAKNIFRTRTDLWLRWSMQAHGRGQLLFAWYLADHALSAGEKGEVSGALCFWHAGLAWRVGRRDRALHSLEEGLLRDPRQASYLQKALENEEVPLPLRHLLRRYRQAP